MRDRDSTDAQAPSTGGPSSVWWRRDGRQASRPSWWNKKSASQIATSMRRIVSHLMTALVMLALGGAAEGRSIMVQEQEVDHSLWDGLLRRHVIQDTVDYEGFRAEADVLEQYLTIIREATAAQLPLQEAKLAYWINAYNATVVQAVLDQGPLQSVKDVGGFFDRTRHPVNREELTLDEIEARGRALGDWRIHFAVVCASSSCPVLRAEAYAADRLEDQLADQTRVFLADSSRGLGLEGKTLWVSKIFQWYTGDFVPAKELGIFKRLTAERLLAVIKPYVPKDLVLEGRRLTLQFMEYDWTLNAHASP